MKVSFFFFRFFFDNLKIFPSFHHVTSVSPQNSRLPEFSALTSFILSSCTNALSLAPPPLATASSNNPSYTLHMVHQVTSTVLCPPLPGQRHRSRPIKASAPIHTCTLPVCRAYHNLPPEVIEIVASFFFFLAPFFYIRAPSSLCFFFPTQTFHSHSLLPSHYLSLG